MLLNIPYASERKLLEYIQQGSEGERKRAFLALYDRYHDEIWGLIEEKVPDEEEAREILDEVWALSQSGLLNFVWREEAMSGLPLKRWLSATAENRIKAYYRRKEQEGAVGKERKVQEDLLF